MGESKLYERVNVVAGVLPVDLAGADNDGAWVSLERYRRCCVVFFAEPGTAAQDPVLELEQATDGSGTGVKALAFERIASKQGATIPVTVEDTIVTQTAAASYTNGTAGEQAQIWQVDVDDRMLDKNNGFTHIRAKCDDTGATAGKLGCILYLLHDADHVGAPLPAAS